MNAPVIISPAVARLAISEVERAEALASPLPVPPQPVSAYDDLEQLATYDGITVFQQRRTGLFYNFETGWAWTIEEVKADIDDWRKRIERERLEEGPADPHGFAW